MLQFCLSCGNSLLYVHGVAERRSTENRSFSLSSDWTRTRESDIVNPSQSVGTLALGDTTYEFGSSQAAGDVRTIRQMARKGKCL